MGQVSDAIDERTAAFIRAQRMFFVATAPLDANGRVNLSPKGLDTFAVLDPKTVAYLDLTGSGVETIAHLRENARITICFAAFEGAPKILRLYGRGTVLVAGDPAVGGAQGTRRDSRIPRGAEQREHRRAPRVAWLREVNTAPRA